LGLKLVDLEKDHPQRPKPPPMAKERIDDGAGDPIKMFLEEALARQRNEMMDNFAQLIRCMSAAMEGSSTRSHFGGDKPFKIKVKFDIPLFEF